MKDRNTRKQKYWGFRDCTSGKSSIQHIPVCIPLLRRVVDTVYHMSTYNPANTHIKTQSRKEDTVVTVYTSIRFLQQFNKKAEKQKR